MAQTKFKVEDGLLVRGQANVTGPLKVDGEVTLNEKIITDVNVQGDVLPTQDGTYQLGNTTHRWVIFASSIDAKESVTQTKPATFLDTITVSGDIKFTSNNYVIGNSTSQAIIYSTNTDISDTLYVGTPDHITPKITNLLVNNETFYAKSNLTSNGTTLSLAAQSYDVTYIKMDGKVIDPGIPSTIIDEVDKGKFTTLKYIVQAKMTDTNKHMYSSEILVTYHAESNTTYFSEYNQVFSSTRFMNFAATPTGTKIRLVANTTATPVDAQGRATVDLRVVRTGIL